MSDPVAAVIESAHTLFPTMLGLTITLGQPARCSAFRGGQVYAAIKFSGTVHGTVALCLTRECAAAYASALAGTSVASGTPELTDVIGELANMLAGGAKARLELEGAAISCPTVVYDQPDLSPPPRGHPCVVIPCQSKAGEFSIHVALASDAPVVSK